MVQPKHNPQEALERMKLMMKYDSSKTLTENVEVIKEQGGKGAVTTAAATTGGALLGAGVGAALPTSVAIGAAGTGAAGTGAASGLVYGLAGSLGVGLGTAGAIVGGAAALALTPLIYWMVTKDNAKGKIDKIFKYCTTDRDKINKVPRGLSDAEIRNLSDRMYTAMKGLFTNNDLYAAFNELKTASDFCAIVDRFSKDWAGEGDGDLLEWLDDDIDSDSDWNKIYIPIRNVVEDTLLNVADDTIKDDTKKDDTKKVSQYKSCPDTFPIAKFCKNSTIGKIQGCLGIVADGAFGPKTEAALIAKGLSGTEITQDSLDKACYKKTKPEFEDDDTEDTTSNQSTQSADDAEEA